MAEGSWPHQSGDFLPWTQLEKEVKLDAVGFYHSSEDRPPEPAWKISWGGNSYIMTAGPQLPSVTSGARLYSRAIRYIGVHSQDPRLGEVCERMYAPVSLRKSKILERRPTSIIFTSGLARELVSTNQSLFLKLAGPSLEDRWRAIKLHQVATVAATSLHPESRPHEVGNTTEEVTYTHIENPVTENLQKFTNWSTWFLNTHSVDRSPPRLSQKIIQFIPDDGRFEAFEGGVSSGDDGTVTPGGGVAERSGDVPHA